eukprot:CAMPEP_0113556584 /NCGR_PEP_ID=MMETSP0015_2-20120614/17330_1 /TAXON_ID=2838 /ORGANISM="Odontella" /LENGTH=164 /DNA_ID=CAMNT_0000457941 /DNA_START=132 /DNA_END=626 /DNA_ORIENTATION=- /assembly_acc=CAM_ASM_000160
MMKSILSSLLALVLLAVGSSAFSSTGSAFAPASSRAALMPRVSSAATPSTSTTTTGLSMVFGNKKSAAAKAAEEEKASQFWQGDWVCKDCGYIYQRGECAGLYFEEQGPGFRCPQCSGPRRRYAKKVGDVVGTTLDGGDAPILLFSFGGVALTIAFGIWAVNNL